jgi:hypothetical protein
VIDTDDGRPPAPSTDRILQAYLAFGSTVGVVLLLIGAASALIAVRQWVLPSSAQGFGVGPFGSVEGSEAALRSLLGAVAWAVPGALVLVWHRRRARSSMEPAAGMTWGGALFVHLVAAVSLVVASGGAVAGLQSLRDAVVRECFPGFPGGGPLLPGPSEAGPIPDDTVTPPPLISPMPPIEIPIDPGFAPEPECYPERGDALRGALDAGLVLVVAAGLWWWAIRPGRRRVVPPDDLI